MKKFITSILVLFGIVASIVLFTNINVASAPFTLKTQPLYFDDPDVQVNGYGTDFDKGYVSMFSSQDRPDEMYFCLDVTIPTWTGVIYTKETYLENMAISWLIDNFFSDQQFIANQNEKTKYAMTQFAIWRLANPTDEQVKAIVNQNKPIQSLLAEAAKTQR